jgi:hypothetical protein
VQVAAVRAQATADRDALRKETARLEAEIFAEARHAADLIAQEGRARIETEVASHARYAQHVRVAEAHQTGAFGVRHEARLEDHLAQLVGGAA